MPSATDTDYQLRSGASAINEGRVPTVPNLPGGLTYDYRNTRTRPINGIYDIGAYEYQQTSSILFSDDFSTDTTGDYQITLTDTRGGTGSFNYDATGKRAQVLTGDNVGIQFARSVPSLSSGTFSIDFLPTTPYPLGGIIDIRLKQDANNYYELSNSDGYGPYQMKKVVAGVEVENVSFTNEYTQNTDYTITISFSPNLTTVNAFGDELTLSTDSNTVLVNSFEIETNQQDSYYDNILYTTSTTSSTFSDDFSTDTTGDYQITHTDTRGGTGSFNYDATGKRAQVLTGDNVGIQFSHSVSSLSSGTFSIDFLPTTKYPLGGIIDIRLKQNSNNYYELSNSDGYGPYQMKKVVAGVEVENVSFTNGYTQNTTYNIEINFSPNLTTVVAFGETLTLNTDSNTVLVNSFEVETNQQDAFYDNILYTE